MIAQYPHFEIAPSTWEINEYDGSCLYLVEGDARALLIDTGVGIGDISAFVRTLTDKPVDVFLTHNHRDHIGGAPVFDRVHISAIDKRMNPMLCERTSAESRRSFARHTCLRYPGRQYPWTEDDIIQHETEPEVVSIEDGHVFDLGGRRIACLLCPGHTPGSMVAIDSREGTLFAGDACNRKVGMGVRPIPGMRHATLEEALAALRRIWDMGFDRTRVYNGHCDFRTNGKPLDEIVYPSLMQGIESILADNYTAQKEWIQMIDTVVETAIFDDVRIEFHSDNIRK